MCMTEYLYHTPCTLNSAGPACIDMQATRCISYSIRLGLQVFRKLAIEEKARGGGEKK